MKAVVPQTPEQAAAVQNGVFVAGGTDLLPLLKNQARRAETLVFLHRLKELRGVEERGVCLYLGAGETLRDLADSPAVSGRFPAVAQAAASAASPQLRNVATLGGNLLQDRRCIYFNQSAFWRSALPPCFKTGGAVCHQAPNSPVCRAVCYSDLATALVLYGAEADCLESGVRAWVPVEELLRRHSCANGLAAPPAPPRLVLRFRLPLPPAGERSGFTKYALRASIDFPIVNFALRCGGGRPAEIAAGAVAPCPVLLRETARLLDRPDVPDSQVLASCRAELDRLSAPIREACIPPARKRDAFGFLARLLFLRRP